MLTKPLKIVTPAVGCGAQPEIRAALEAVNGKATQHCFTGGYEVSRAAEEAERRLEALGVPKGDRKGAVYTAQSGEKLPSSYKYTAAGTVIRMERRATGWFLVSVARYDLYPGHTPVARLHLTAAQDATAVAVLRRGYSVLS